MLKKVILYTAICISACSCSIFNNQESHQKPTDLLFQNKEIDGIKINVQRDEKLCKNDTNNNQDCPIKLYIDDFKSGIFYINNKATYYLKPNDHILKVKNCTNKCTNNELKIDSKDQLKDVTFILSVDNESNPIIIKK